MKRSKILVILILVFTLMTGMTACGSNTAGNDTTGNDTASGQQADASQTTEQTVTPEEATIEQAIPEADPEANADALIGSWKDITAADSFVNITKTEAGYQYEDNDGKCPAAFENGVLKVKASDTDTADIYIDPKTGHMITAYQGGMTEYEKK